MTSSTPSGDIADRLALFEGELRSELARLHRSRAEITVVAVTKTHPPGTVREAHSAGLRVFGENRVQEAALKIPELPADCDWHLVGHLQRNKARDAVRLFSLIHSVDSLPLAEEIDRRVAAEGQRQRILLQVNTTAEAQKSGCEPNELVGLARAVVALPHVDLCGLMTIGPFTDDRTAVARSFGMLRDLFEECRGEGFGGGGFMHLSMGMSDDWRLALEHGATILRVGTALLGERPVGR